MTRSCSTWGDAWGYYVTIASGSAWARRLEEPASRATGVTNEDGRWHVVLDGVIYNFPSIATS